MPETITACPGCDSAEITPLADAIYRDSAPEHEWRCCDCGHEFDEPTRREPQNNRAAEPQSGLAAELLAMDADEVGGGA